MKPAVFIGLDNYQEMLFDDDVFWQALWNTLVIIASAPIGIAIALGLALLVNSDIRGRDVYRTIIFLSYPLMTVAVAIIWRWMFDERVGLINYVARALDLVDKPIPFLNSFTWALPSVIAANIWQMLGFYMIILLTGLQNIPGNLLRGRRDRRRQRVPPFPAHHAAAAAGRRCSSASSSACSIRSRASIWSMS